MTPSERFRYRYSARAIQDLQHRRGLCIRHAVEALRTEAHLEGRDHMASGNIQLAGLLDRITESRQLLLIPADGRRIDAEICLLSCNGICVWPNAKAGIGETFPREQWAWIKLAQRRDITVADDVPWLDVIALDDILEQRDQGLI